MYSTRHLVPIIRARLAFTVSLEHVMQLGGASNDVDKNESLQVSILLPTHRPDEQPDPLRSCDPRRSRSSIHVGTRDSAGRRCGGCRYLGTTSFPATCQPDTGRFCPR
ncbi:hypothetical protein C8Q74DRAFT_1243374 [Fomes fomentarius]|nr:hypothetical protein C8Q74DRAFT_1243374 [Fomes fomentarius]